MNIISDNEIIYHVFLDRFTGFNEHVDDTKPVWVGGTLKGIKEKISYFKSLRVTWLLISPFYKGYAYHGYQITDFYEVDLHFGTKADLKDLVDALHENNIKVMVDYIPNHCSKEHPFFIDAQKNKESKYKDWFTFTKWPSTYVRYVDMGDLPKFNLENKETADYIIENALYWCREIGLDGFRLDHAIGPSHDFLKKFSQKIKAHNKDFLLLGEVWFRGFTYKHLKTLNARGVLKNYFWNKLLGRDIDSVEMTDSTMLSYVGIFDGCLDFTFNKLVRDYLSKGNTSKESFERKLKTHYKKFPKDFILPTFLSNHDMNRFLFEGRGDTQKLERALHIQFSIQQPKIIYYGEEIGMSQEKGIEESKAHGDIEARKKMVWDEKNHNKFIVDIYKNML